MIQDCKEGSDRVKPSHGVLGQIIEKRASISPFSYNLLFLNHTETILLFEVLLNFRHYLDWDIMHHDGFPFGPSMY